MPSAKADSVVREVRELLTPAESATEVLPRVLALVLERFDCAVGTIHRLDATSGRLELLVHRGIPDTILDRVRSIPVGKGMAGLAAERRAPVQVCNLQTDDSGVAKPDARDTKMEGSIAVPMLVSGELIGAFGVGKPVAYDFTEAEADRLMQIAATIGEYLAE